MRPLPRLVLSALTLIGVLAGSAAVARADILVLTNGGTMPVKSYRVDGELITVTLRRGGEATFDRALVARIAADEVPELEPEPETIPASERVRQASGPSLEELSQRPFAEIIESTAARHGVSPALVHAVQPFALGPIAAGYLGLLLLSSTCIAYGLFVSALTASQVLAGFLTVMPLFLLWLLSWNEAAVGADTVTVLRALSLFDHFQSFSVGVIELRDVFYFVFLTTLFWWGTLRVLEARQWRGRR